MTHTKRLFGWSSVAVLLSILFFAAFPNFDLWLTGNFYDPALGFMHADHALVQFSYKLFANLHWPIILGLIAFWASVRYLFNQQKSKLQIVSIYLLLALFLGPGLLVNTFFKSEWGRARPIQISDFGGDKPYTAPFTPANNCQTNCSFVSGHAALGFYFISLAWVFNRKRFLALGLAIGALVGFGRILQGGHFFSDVVFAFWSVFITCALLGWLMNMPKRLYTHAQ